VLHKALHKALRVYGVPTSSRSADRPPSASSYEVRSETLPKLIASNKALHKALRKALHKALHKALRKALHKVLHKALHKALRVYGVPTSLRSGNLPSGEAEAEGGRVAASLCFIVVVR